MKTIVKGLHIQEDEKGYWSVKQSRIYKVIVKTARKSDAQNAAYRLAEIANWDTEIDVVEHLKNHRSDLYQQIKEVIEAYDVEECMNHSYLESEDASGYVTYLVVDEEGEWEVKGVSISNGLAIHQEPNGRWTIDHVYSGTMLSELSTYEKAKHTAEKIEELFLWKDVHVPEYILECEEVRNYLREVKDAAEKGRTLPDIPEMLQFQVIFLQTETIRDRWESFKTAWNSLNEMVGIEPIVDKVRRLIGELRGRMRTKGKLKEKSFSMHMMFTGPAGTGKTEVARKLSKLFYALGYLKEDVVIETERAEIVGSHIGDTEKNMTRLLNEAMGGVLFIDEAHALAKKGSQNDFGMEAINVLIKTMEDHRDELLVILAGYSQGMEELMDTNEGFRSRISKKIEFRHYTPKQLIQIGMRMIESFGCRCEAGVEEALNRVIQERVQHGVLKGNAREVRKIVEDTIRQMYVRIGENQKAEIGVVIEEDIILATSKTSAREQEGFAELKKQAMAELDQLIGLTALKSEVKEILNQVEVEKLRFENGMSTQKPRLHMIFAGPPGTGKTTVARIMGKFFKSIGLLSNGDFKESTRVDFIGQYQGHTAEKTTQLIEGTRGGILFIDEAYAIHQGNGDSFGKEAVDTLIPALENYKNDWMVILAGYTNEMKKLLEVNTGFQSRINYHFEFPSYSGMEIVEIARLKMKKNKWTLSDETNQHLRLSILNYERVKGEFNGNARWVDNFIDEVIKKQAGRIVPLLQGKTEREVKMLLGTIEKEDIDAAIASM